MNVNDVEFTELEPGQDMLVMIFEKQESLKEKYHHIEEKNGVGYGLLKNGKFNIDDVRSQSLLKDFAWRITEELAEACECHPEHDKEHMVEEIADALHFLTELCIVAGITPEDITADIFAEGQDLLKTLYGDVIFNETITKSSNPFLCIYQLGLAMNCLKQKPWKQTHILTDQEKFRNHIILAFRMFIHFCVSLGIPANTLYSFYFKKNKVNQFRQESNY